MIEKRYRRISWADMPLYARKAWIRMCKALPAYDLALTQGWETFQPAQDRGRFIYAVNRSAQWYVAETTEDLSAPSMSTAVASILCSSCSGLGGPNPCPLPERRPGCFVASHKLPTNGT